MNKTACEEAADYLEFLLRGTKQEETIAMRFIKVVTQNDLRSEGRELKRFRKLVVTIWGEGSDNVEQSNALLALVHMAKRLEKKARKAK